MIECRIRLCSLVEKNVRDVFPSVMKGHVLHLLLGERNAPEAREGLPAVFGPDQYVP